MVSYEPLWETMKKKGVSTYSLINSHNMNPRTINNLKHNKGITVDNQVLSDLFEIHFHAIQYNGETITEYTGE